MTGWYLKPMHGDACAFITHHKSNPLFAILLLGNGKIHLYHFLALRWCKHINSFLVEDRGLYFINLKAANELVYHGIDSNFINLVLMWHFDFSTRIINTLWPNDVIWWRWSWSTLAQVMACCLTAPSHYLNQCWLMISGVLWHSPDSNFTENIKDNYLWN